MISTYRNGLGRRGAVLGLGASGLLPIAPALANTPSGTVHIEQVQVAFIGSGNMGGGTLNFQGKTYHFRVAGLGVGGLGVSKMQADGQVYDLKDIRQFAGPYAQGRVGAVAMDKSTGSLWLQNPNGVGLSLRARRTGLALALGGDVVVIEMK
jgi:hypothetical protein